ncbi:MAG: helix-turn-helix domain-containing protein [Pseudomonadota bacterium]|nr:helix-turn-helix domain-containing protein [Pseudomonadota bacterium]
MSTPAELATNLSRNLRLLRELRRYTQARLAAVSGVPRPTIAALESGGANPTLAVLCQVAAGLQVSIEELIGTPRDMGRLYRAADLPTRETRGVEFRQVVPDAIPGITLERMAFPPHSRVTGIPHTPGSREYLICEAGRLVLTTESQRWELAVGDVVVYRGDQSHGYHNAFDEPAVVFTLIMPG